VNQILYLVRLSAIFQCNDRQIVPSVEAGIFTQFDKAEACRQSTLPLGNPFHLTLLQCYLPEDIDEEDEDVDGFTLCDPGYGGDIAQIPFVTLITLMQEWGMIPPQHFTDPSAAEPAWWSLDDKERKNEWADCWEENVPIMTNAQKRTIWELLANGGPYEVVEVALED
jgi:hypothetical protein